MSASKAKGTKWESEIVRALREMGFVQAERRAGNGVHDRGDITGIPGLVIEAKNHNRTELAEWVKEAVAERDNAGARYGVVWHHRRGHSRAEDGFVTMTGGTFLLLLADAMGLYAEASE
jgi:hypothetical protein